MNNWSRFPHQSCLNSYCSVIAACVLMAPLQNGTQLEDKTVVVMKIQYLLCKICHNSHKGIENFRQQYHLRYCSARAQK